MTTAATNTRTWTVNDVADFLGVPVQTLYQWRSHRCGPPAYRVGKHLRYLPAEVMDWLREQTGRE